MNTPRPICLSLACLWFATSTALAAAPPTEADVFGLLAARNAAFAEAKDASPSKLSQGASTGAFHADPTTAKYFPRIRRPHRSGGYSLPAMTSAELEMLQRNGFVVLESRASQSFGGSYLDIYQHDMPVYVTADSVLHAFHRSYDALLEELETATLSPMLAELLAGMQAEVKKLEVNPALASSLADADVVLAVASSLLSGRAVPSTKDPQRAASVLRLAKSEARTKLILFGREREEDFTQLHPRGHYTKTAALQRYFRAMMWLGRTELAVAGPGGSPRELGAALVLRGLAERSGKLPLWSAIDSALRVLVGRPDSMDLTDLGAVATLVGAPLSELDGARLAAMEEKLAQSTLGIQLVRSQLGESNPLDATRKELPRSFRLFGQRFTLDAWALSELVFDAVILPGEAQRTVPSGVDVGFTVFANPQAGELLAQRIAGKSPDALIGRDGLPVQAHFLAVKHAVDQAPEASWDDSVYARWLKTLRALSAPAKGVASMATPAWGERLLAAQLGSWAELRHDTVLYVKQSYSMGVGCEYPAGFVEPNPAFWRELAQAAGALALLAEKLPLSPSRQKRVHGFFARFGTVCDSLASIADRELAAQPLTPEETKMLHSVMEVHESRMCGGPPTYSGWYPTLFYFDATKSTKPDALVADVHTSPDDGIVLASTGAVDQLVVVVNSGDDVMAFAGPVFSYYETLGQSREDDQAWWRRLPRAAPPAWTQGWRSEARSKRPSMESED